MKVVKNICAGCKEKEEYNYGYWCNRLNKYIARNEKPKCKR